MLEKTGEFAQTVALIHGDNTTLLPVWTNLSEDLLIITRLGFASPNGSGYNIDIYWRGVTSDKILFRMNTTNANLPTSEDIIIILEPGETFYANVANGSGSSPVYYFMLGSYQRIIQD